MWNSNNNWCGSGWSSSKKKGSLTPPPAIPDAANMRLFLNSLNMDGSNNSTMVNGALFSSWLNLGTLGGVFAQAGVNRPTFSAAAGPGAKATALFGGSNSLISSLAPSVWKFASDGTGVTTYVLFMTTTDAGFAGIVGTYEGSAAEGGSQIILNPSRTLQYLDVGSGGTALSMSTAANAMDLNQYELVCVPMGVSRTPDAELFVNGVSLVSVNAGGPFPVLAPSLTMVVGALGPANANALNGGVAAVMMFQGVHDATMRANVKAYLETLYGVVFA